MRYSILLPALASLAFAQDSVAVADSPDPTPDALPLEDLRDIPVPTYTEVIGVTAQDIPYATASAIAVVTSEVAATPLSVFPAATDVPINSAGEAGSDDSEAADANVIVNTGSKLKRALTGVARQPLRKRGDCKPEGPLSTNYYAIDVSTPEAFKADAHIADAANKAPTPVGYYQNFKNKPAANSAMNYLGYSVIQSGQYDVQYCANKCDAKAGCFAFNIYFERDPSVGPNAVDCPNPDGALRVKCSYWGTGLDEKTLTNPGQWRAKFWVTIAGSNAYTSYKLDGPVDGWNGPQVLGNAAINAPLWDCENKWSYLGYKLLQAGSVDPNLCAAACDAQTAYNAAHPTAADPYPCNAFGSYILTKTNSTGSYQVGQMCTLYTAYWDAKYAKNTGSSDPSIGSTYSYSHSTFYGKKGAQLSCSSDFQSSSGTYIKGGVDKKASINAASSAISASSLQPFCSSILGYTIPATTATVTATITPHVTTMTTSTAVVTNTVVVNVKRDTTESLLPLVMTVDNVVKKNIELVTAASDASQTLAARDAISTPTALTQYPADVVTSACSLAATSATSTSTSTVTATITEAPEIVVEVVTATSTQLVSSTTTTTKPVPTCLGDSISANNGAFGYSLSVACDTTVDRNAQFTRTDSAKTPLDCLKATDSDDVALAMTFDLTTKVCNLYIIQGGSMTTKAAKGVVFGYYDVLVQEGQIILP